MNVEQKQARKYLKEALLDEYETATHAAALTPLQKQIVDLHIINRLSVVQISLKLHISVRCISSRLAKVYKKIYNLIEAGL